MGAAAAELALTAGAEVVVMDYAEVKLAGAKSIHVNLADIARVAVPVLSHRLITNINADAEGITPQSLVNRLLEELTRENTKD